MPKLISWNIRHGGRAQAKNIVSTLVAHDPDLILLCEHRSETAVIQQELVAAGYAFTHATNVPDHKNGLLIASKQEFRITAPEHAPLLHHLWCEVKIWDMDILFVHIPTSQLLESKIDFWQNVIQYAKRKAHDTAIIVGDYNTGFKADAQGAPFSLGENMTELETLGWTDLWKHSHHDQQEYTWYSSSGNGFRVDHAFGTAAGLPVIKSVDYSHAERVLKVSDHSAVVVDCER